MFTTAWKALFGPSITPQEQLKSLRYQISIALKNCNEQCDEMLKKTKEHEERMCHLIKKKKIDLAKHEAKLLILYRKKADKIYQLKSEMEQLGMEMQEMEALSNLMKLRERTAKIMKRYNGWMNNSRLMDINTLQENLEKAREDNEMILLAGKQQFSMNNNGFNIDELVQKEIDQHLTSITANSKTSIVTNLNEIQNTKIPNIEIDTSLLSTETDQLSRRLNMLKSRGFNE